MSTAPAPIRLRWSADEENFNFDSLAELLEQHDHLVTGAVVWCGEADTPDVTAMCNADDVIDILANAAHDIAGEYAEDFPDVDAEAKQELNNLLAAWIGKHCQPSFYTVANTREYVLRESDIPTFEQAK